MYFSLRAALLPLLVVPHVLGNLAQGYSDNGTTGNGKLTTYSIPEGFNTSDAFTVKIRSPNQEWKTLELYRPQVIDTDVATGAARKRDTSMGYFDMDGSIEVSATYHNGDVNSVRIRPDSYGISPTQDGNTFTFTVEKPQNLVLEVNGNVFDVVHLFANPLEGEKPSKTDAKVKYYGPGLHKVNESIALQSGETLYLEGGAILVSRGIQFGNATNASIKGRGVLATEGTVLAEINLLGASNILIDGISAINVLPRVYESKDVTIRNFKSFSSTQWGDGIDVYCSENVLVEKAFIRSSDDCFALYNHRNDWYGDNKNITLQDSSLWADVAHPVNVGTHGNTENPERTDGLVIRNLDILDHHEKQIDYQGCIAINAGDRNLVENVLIEDVRVEDFRLGQLINLRIMFNQKYNTSPGRGIRHVTIKDMSYNGNDSMPSIVHGYDEERTIHNVTFKGLKINGQVVSKDMTKASWYLVSDYIPMFVGPHVTNLTFLEN